MASPANAAWKGPSPFRKPAPADDAGPHVREPMFGACAETPDSDVMLVVMEWVAKRTWYGYGWEYERADFQGPPSMQVRHRDGWLEVEGTVASGGVPLRNQIVTAEVEHGDAPLLVLLRSTDAFGEILLEIDLKAGEMIAYSVTVSRSMIGGQSHSSPMPEQSHRHAIAVLDFPRAPEGCAQLTLRTVGSQVSVTINDYELPAFEDPDPAAGSFGFGSRGLARVRNIEQWELISRKERKRRKDCIRAMTEFCRQIDTYYDSDVRARNLVEATPAGLVWTWKATGAAAQFRIEGPRILATVGAGLYGNDTLVNGVFPRVSVTDASGARFDADPEGTASISGDNTVIECVLPLRDERGRTALARAQAKLTVQTVWFWTVSVEGIDSQVIEADIGLAPAFAMHETALESAPDALFGMVPQPGKAVLRTNYKAGFYVKATAPEHTTLGIRAGGALAVATTDRELRFATVVLPAQPLNMVGFKNRMVHFIRYPEGPIQHWRRMPSPQEYPTDVDLLRYAANGTDAMVWHHTWISSDFRDHEGFFPNHEEMKRAMETTHRLGMKMIGYLGIVPGGSSLLRYEDTSPLGGKAGYGVYDKNWDLQDFTFYHVAGRYPDFLVWLTDYFCKVYNIDGYYLDGGAFGNLAYGYKRTTYYPEDQSLTLDEIRHRTYYRVRKVLELNGAGYGLEPWSGLDWMINGFYDCMMIGESFQEADPTYYRDGHNALLTGCMIKMYGMRESSQNPYNIAMAAINLSDIQVCSGNGAWGDDPDTVDTWRRVRPLWDLLDSIDWDHLLDARPWYAQELVSGEGFYAGNYTMPDRVLILLANQTESPGAFRVRVDTAKLPAIAGTWHVRYCLGRNGDYGPLGDGVLTIDLPALHDGPIGLELTPSKA